MTKCHNLVLGKVKNESFCSKWIDRGVISFTIYRFAEKFSSRLGSNSYSKYSCKELLGSFLMERNNFHYTDI